MTRELWLQKAQERAVSSRRLMQPQWHGAGRTDGWLRIWTLVGGPARAPFAARGIWAVRRFVLEPRSAWFADAASDC